MGRYKAPRKHGSAYITPEGERALRDELQLLWKVERPQITDTVREAAKNGDRSENGDYIYGKRRLREIDSRVRYLTKRLKDLTIVDEQPDDIGRVFFGAKVTVKDKKGKKLSWHIVGPDEFDLSKGKVSIDSPLARALIGKSVGDVTDVKTPDGIQTYIVKEVSYVGSED